MMPRPNQPHSEASKGKGGVGEDKRRGGGQKTCLQVVHQQQHELQTQGAHSQPGSCSEAVQEVGKPLGQSVATSADVLYHPDR